MSLPKRTLATTTITVCRRSIPTYQPRWRHRNFSYTARCLVNPLHNLSHFSAAKEAQFLSREKRIPREEFHPYLQLIRSSEVDPFAPIPGASPSVIAALKHAKSGEADTDSALRLAVNNLIDQLRASNREKDDILRALVRAQERYRREERNALMMLFACFGVLAFIVVKTNAMDDLVEHLRGAGDEWSAFDWGVLGHSSSHLQHLAPRRMSITVSESQTKDAKRNVLSIPEVVIENPSDESNQLLSTDTSPRSPSQPSGFLSRLFWAGPGN